MDKNYKSVQSSRISISQLMLPSYSNFRGKIHGGYLLSLLDQIAFACASKYSGAYCVTASIDTVDFLKPIEIGELVTLKACVNYVGNSSMEIGIRVIAENIQTGKTKHCNSSYFTMVAKDSEGNTVKVPKLILSDFNDVRRFYDGIRRINFRKEKNYRQETFDHTTEEALNKLLSYNVKVDLKRKD